MLDLKVTGHSVERPQAVQRGEERDRIEVGHESYSLFKPNNVTAKQCKATNVAGLLGVKSLQASPHLQMVWRNLLCGMSVSLFVVCLFLLMSFMFDLCSMFYLSLFSLCFSCVLFVTINLGLRHFPREKVLGPAKPLWFLKGHGITIDAGCVYQLC